MSTRKLASEINKHVPKKPGNPLFVKRRTNPQSRSKVDLPDGSDIFENSAIKMSRKMIIFDGNFTRNFAVINIRN
jgi:hypothetical protein